MTHYLEHFERSLAALKKEKRYRVFADLERQVGRLPKAILREDSRTKEVTVWCSNDYLGMSQHPQVINAMRDAAQMFGVGAGGTRNISGTHHAIVSLEEDLARLHEKEAALVFTSGYVSNVGGIGAIGRLLPNCLILSDEQNHNSMIEGVRASGASKLIWRHNDLAHLEELLAKAGKDRPKLIAFESVYSMDGDVAPIAQICDLAEKYHAMSMGKVVAKVSKCGDLNTPLANPCIGLARSNPPSAWGIQYAMPYIRLDAARKYCISRIAGLRRIPFIRPSHLKLAKIHMPRHLKSRFPSAALKFAGRSKKGNLGNQALGGDTFAVKTAIYETMSRVTIR